jgi:hypothetical protein
MRPVVAAEGSSADGAFWLNLQIPRGLAAAEKRLGAKIRAEVEAG